MWFHPTETPIATCRENTCRECPLGAALVWGFPLPSLLVGGQWLLTVLYGLSTAAFFATLKKFLCTRCMNFACPLNGVPEYLRQRFFRRNPAVGRAWGVVDSPPPPEEPGDDR